MLYRRLQPTQTYAKYFITKVPLLMYRLIFRLPRPYWLSACPALRDRAHTCTPTYTRSQPRFPFPLFSFFLHNHLGKKPITKCYRISLKAPPFSVTRVRVYTMICVSRRCGVLYLYACCIIHV